jgi:phage terminase large subunit-like protein
MPTLNVTLPALHTSQRRVVDSDKRFRVLACGRRWGKTRLGAALCIYVALSGGRSWWCAPSYPMSIVGWRLIHRLALQIPDVEIRKAERSITFPTGGEIWVRSADNPDSLRGEGLDFAVLDECAFMKEPAWQEAIRPALSDRQGRAMFISTPKGRNWFWRLWQRCQDDNDSEWQGWQLPTSDNPYIADEEIEAARKSLPERIYRQEYLALFIDDSGGVFRGIMQAATAIPESKPQPAGQYIIGVDWGKHNDFTVLTVLNAANRSLVHMDRFNQIDYAVQVNRLVALHERFKSTAIIAERNSMGDPLIEQLQRRGMPVYPFITTNATKARAIDELGLAFERGDIQIINEPVLVGELQAYEMERLPSGMMRYNAPQGLHDDCVMSLAIGWQGLMELEEPALPSVMTQQDYTTISPY